MTIEQIRHLVRLREPEIADSMRHAESAAYTLAIQKFHPTGNTANPGEVDIAIRAFAETVNRLSDTFADAVKRAPVQAHAGGVFCHKRATFSFTDQLAYGSVGAEIGDLLVVLTYKGSASIWRSAQLIQFKYGGREITPPVISTPQYTLYNRWPEFKWLRKNRPDGARHVPGGGPQDLAKYCFLPEINQHFSGALAVVQTSEMQGAHRALRAEFTAHTQGLTGKSYCVDPGTTGWDQVVLELIEATHNKAVTVSTQQIGTAGNPTVPAHAGVLSFRMLRNDFSTLTGKILPPRSEDFAADLDADNGGVNMIFLSISARE